jgi:RNA polymerase sigma-70 factor (ECF subfamily)
MSSHGLFSRRNWRAERPLTRAVRLSKSSGERVLTDASAQTSNAVRAPSREALLQACARGDRAALHNLYKVTAPQLFGLALSILRSRDLAEDIVQDSFILVWRQAHSFDPSRGAAMAWLARIVRNRCFDLLRRRGREAPLDDIVAQTWEDPASSPADLTELSQDAERLRDCLDELDESPRKSLMLAYFEGMTYTQVAGRMGAPLSTVKSWIRRSLIRLKDCMER